MGKSPQFDDHQWAGRRANPINARRTTDGEFETPGISFEDYVRMSSQSHKPSGERRLPTPLWAVRQDMLQQVLARYMEARAMFPKAQPGTPLERIERAQKLLDMRRPGLIATADNLCRQFVELKRVASTVPELDRLKELSVQIENVDTCLRMENCAGIVARVVYLYYKCALDSVAVGMELGFKPPHLRQLLWRLHKTSALIGAADPEWRKAIGDVEEDFYREKAAERNLRLEDYITRFEDRQKDKAARAAAAAKRKADWAAAQAAAREERRRLEESRAKEREDEARQREAATQEWAQLQPQARATQPNTEWEKRKAAQVAAWQAEQDRRAAALAGTILHLHAQGLTQWQIANRIGKPVDVVKEALSKNAQEVLNKNARQSDAHVAAVTA